MELSKIFGKKKNVSGESENKSDKLKYVLTIVKASVMAVLLTVILFLLAALVLMISGVDDECVPIVVSVIRIVSICFAGIICGRSVNKMGWLAGIIAGIVYVVFTIIIGFLFYDTFSLNNILIVDVISGGIAGFISGMIGINSKKSKTC